MEKDLKENDSREIISYILIGYKIVEEAIKYKNKEGGKLIGKLKPYEKYISQLVLKIKGAYITKLINYEIGEIKFNNIIILRRLDIGTTIKAFFKDLVKKENLKKRIEETERRI